MTDLDFFFPDKVQIQTADGTQHDGVRAQFYGAKILLPVDDLPITEGDVVRRTLPNGITDEYEIDHIDFQPRTRHSPPITTLTVRKRGSRLHSRPAAVQNVYNVSGTNPRVNVNSSDNSVNVIAVDNSKFFQDLRSALTRVEDHQLRLTLEVAADRLEQSQGGEAFTAAYKDFLAVAANCITIVAPFLPALSQMLK